MKLPAHVVAYAQVGNYSLSLAGFIGLLYVLFLSGVKFDPTTEKLAYTMLGVFGTIVTQQTAYFYGRQREEPPAAPAPKPPEGTQT